MLTQHVQQIIDNQLKKFKKYYNVYTDKCDEDKEYIIVAVSPIAESLGVNDLPILKDFKIEKDQILYIDSSYIRDEKNNERFDGYNITQIYHRRYETIDNNKAINY